MTSEFISASHYFSDCSMSNFWSTFRTSRVRDELAAIHRDGFTHIILLVPWAQFQPTLDDDALCPDMQRRMRYLFEQARLVGLRVILRVGYLWENAPVRQRTFQRYLELPHSRKHQKAWSRYSRQLGELAAQHDNFEFAFLSWEDFFWPLFRGVIDAPRTLRLELSPLLGFQAHLAQRYDVQDYAALYSDSVSDFSEVAIPSETDPQVWEYADCFDQVLVERFYNLARASFPGLEYEGRIDANPFPIGDRIQPYHWKLVRNGYRRPISYYYLGGSTKAIITADRATSHLQKLVLRYSTLQSSPNKLFIDQFNFVTRNPQYARSSQIDVKELSEFLNRARKILRDQTSGYGIWGYRDWTNDKIFNGAFEFGLDGWSTTGDCTISSQNEGSRLHMRAGASTAQPLFQSLGRPTTLHLAGSSDGGAEIAVSLDGQVVAQLSIGRGTFEKDYELGAPAARKIDLRCVQGSVELERIGLFDHVFSSGMYERDGSERPAVAGIRLVNSDETNAVPARILRSAIWGRRAKS